MGRTRVLVTGMSGLIGGVMRRALEGRYELVALNRRAVPGVTCHQADVSDLAAIRPAFDGVEVVLHLAAFAVAEAAWEDVLRSNVVGTYNVTGHQHYHVGQVLKWVLYHVAELDLYLGVLPFAAFVLLVVTARNFDRRVRIFVAAPPLRPLEQHEAADVHRRIRSFELQEQSVESAEVLHGEINGVRLQLS